MEGSIASRAQPPRGAQVLAPVRDAGVRSRRPLRASATASTPLHRVFVTLWRRKWLIVAMALLGGLLTGLIGLARVPLYQATTQLIIRTPSGSGGAGETLTQDALAAMIDDHITAISSPVQLRRVLAALSELKQPPTGTERESASGEGARTNTITVNIRAALSRIAQDLRAILPSGGAGSTSEDTKIKALSRDLKVGQELRSRVITIGYTDPDPAHAALVANLIARLYVEGLAEKHRVIDQNELDIVTARLPVAKDELLSATDQLERYRLTHGTINASGNDGNSREMAELDQQISLATRELANAEAKLSKASELQSQGAPLKAIAGAIGVPTISASVAAQSDSKNNRLEGALEQDVQRGFDRLQSMVNAYGAQLAALNDRKSGLDALAADMASQLAGLRALEPRVATATQQYNALLARQQDLMRRIASPNAGVEILSPAWPPTYATTLSPVFLVPPGVVLFGAMTAVLVVLWARLDTTLRGEAEAEEALGVPCLGLLPSLRKADTMTLRQLLIERPEGSYSRALLSLLFAVAPAHHKGRPSGVILLTSTLDDDGKTETAWGLALAAARLGARVMLLDLDPNEARPTDAFRKETSDAPAPNNFADILSGRCGPQDAIEDLPDIGISFMAACPTDRFHLLPFFSSVDGAEFIDRLRASFDLVVIVGPSSQQGPAAMLLAQWADAVLFAVKWGNTKGNLARVALAQLGMDGSPPANLSCVLTQVNLRKHVSHRFMDGGDLLQAPRT